MPIEHPDEDTDSPSHGSPRREFLEQAGGGMLGASLIPGMTSGAEAHAATSPFQDLIIQLAQEMIEMVDWNTPPTPEDLAALSNLRRTFGAAGGEWKEIVGKIDRRLDQASLRQSMREPPKPKAKEAPATAEQLQCIADCIDVMHRMREEHLHILSFSIEYLARVSDDPDFIRRTAFAMIRKVIEAHPKYQGDEEGVRELLFAA